MIPPSNHHGLNLLSGYGGRSYDNPLAVVANLDGRPPLVDASLFRFQLPIQSIDLGQIGKPLLQI
jgi:hypothetical protein